MSKRIVCAARLLKCTGDVFLGVRHNCPFMRASINNLVRLELLSKNDLKSDNIVDGFIDNYGKFHNRVDALKIAKDANQILEKTPPDYELFSEDLY